MQHLPLCHVEKASEGASLLQCQKGYYRSSLEILPGLSIWIVTNPDVKRALWAGNNKHRRTEIHTWRGRLVHSPPRMKGLLLLTHDWEAGKRWQVKSYSVGNNGNYYRTLALGGVMRRSITTAKPSKVTMNVLCVWGTVPGSVHILFLFKGHIVWWLQYNSPPS